MARITQAREVPRRPEHDQLALFSVLWALAALWHLLGNPLLAPGWAQALLAVAAGGVLLRPGRATPLALLAGAGLVTIWNEAPILGNHWLLVGFVDLALLAALGVAALRRRWADRTDLANRFLPAARLCLLGFYAFAAFGKLNGGFFDRGTSCAVFYFRESTDSLGIGGLQLGGASWIEWAVIVGTAAVELSIPVLLVVRRTRHVGVVVALGFHLAVALDHHHQFFDFSSVLAALFILFLPVEVGPWVAERVGSIRARLALVDEGLPGRAHLALAIVPMLAGLGVAARVLDPREALEVGWWPWQLAAVAMVALAVRFLRERPRVAAPRVIRPHHAIFAVVPLLVVVNGMTPYLEIKTGYGWNMYANLRTVDGESNHFVVRRTLPVTDEQADLVEIVRTSDPGLTHYAERGYALTRRQLRTYLADHPDVPITYRRGDELVSLQRASDDPDLVEPVPVWQEKLLLFRAVDLQEPERCVPAFGPAR